MRVIAVSTLMRYGILHADAKGQLETWHEDVKRADWKTPHDITQQIMGVSVLTSGRVCFNIKGNDYRLIVDVNYETGIVYILWFGPHAEYDKIDANTVARN
jgi:mRNA interferase HigB